MGSPHYPHPEKGAVYGQVSSTRLDEIKNLHLEVQAGGVIGARRGLGQSHNPIPAI